MKEIDYLAEYARMCESRAGKCTDCPLDFGDFGRCTKTIFNDVPAAKAKIAAWSAAHPWKTYAQDFFSKFPNAPKHYDATPKACRSRVYGDYDCVGIGCFSCWNRTMP